MQLTDRQEQILNYLIKDYIDRAEPVSSEFLRQGCGLTVSSATVRNDLQELTEKGYIVQPHTSAGRIPTDKAYKYFVDKLFAKEETTFPDFISKEIHSVQQKIEEELKLAEELMKSLQSLSTMLSVTHIEEDNILEILTILGPSRNTYDKNIQIINQIIRELEEF